MPATRIEGLTDCHMHVFGPIDRYPGAPDRTYTPERMGLAEYAPVAARLGVDRIVIVQPSAYGTDNRATLDGLATLGDKGRAVVVIDDSFDDATLDAYERQGVRGIRLNLMTPRITDAAAAEATLLAAGQRIARLGWHIQIYADLELVALLAPAARKSAVPVVFDHMGGSKAAAGPDVPGFGVLLDLLKEGKCWVKLSGADIVTWETTDFSRATPFARALIAANPHQLVWGSDWPHLVHHNSGRGDAAPPAGYRPVNEEKLIEALAGWAGDEATLRAILVDNPARLYRF
ncbi:amidohydrolase family protein [Ancylobacter mangrovi]|uniref:amidohydrolase family protein n=1 Tax=Ancylobacter mangrovi TaxID=2972472 RepID=UPI0021626422|nr:amidohydrolase family protein [Ancylobacter mangrovi]MCS0500831.1 amidohydrolase family protein [Ancylobacter mangrovi]